MISARGFGIVCLCLSAVLNSGQALAQDSLNVTMVGSLYAFGDTAVGVAISSTCAYVATLHAGLRVVDVSDQTNPVEVGHFDTPGITHAVAVMSDYAYVVDDFAGLRIVNILDPVNPEETSSYDTPGIAWRVAVLGHHAYVADREAGLRIMDVSDPMNPVEVGYYDTSGEAYGVAVSGDHAYLANGSYFSIFDCSGATSVVQPSEGRQPETILLMPPYPNPFSHTTTVSFALPLALDVSVTIHDVSGRSVMADPLGMINAGHHRYVFNGSGLPSGSYFFHLRAEPHSAVRKMLLVK